MRTWTVLPTAMASVLLAALVTPVAAAAVDHTVSITGTVVTPASYTSAQLAALPQTTYTVAAPGPGRPRSVTGVDLESLVERATLVLPPGKNTQLRVILTVTGRGHRTVTVALGELDPDFGAHPAVLTADHGHVIDLTVPGDRARTRDLTDVTSVRVSVPDATAQTPPPGTVQVVTPQRNGTVPAEVLARLPQRTVSVTFLAGSTSQTHTESGPPLSLVLLAVGVPASPNTAVVAIGDDGYAAAVTLAEDYVGDRPLLLSTMEDGTALTQPRLVADGDVKGGRYVSGVVGLRVVPGSPW